MADKTFVGFGFGPIQSGLFLYEAHASGNFSRFVVAEIEPELVEAVRRNGGCYCINIARKDRIEQVTIPGVELYNPREAGGRKAIIEAVSGAVEIATCLPSVAFFDTGGEGSVARLITAGLAQRLAPLPTLIYAAENHNHAAEILTGHLQQYAAPAVVAQVQTLNTVIGKMSGIITDASAIKSLGLATLTPHTPRAVLVEEFNRILISRVTLPDARRGIEVFSEKDDLLPFEEAKLYGHNAIHALIGYLAHLKGLKTMAEAGRDAALMDIARRAFLAESGAALIQRHMALGDTLFTPDGYRAYAEDLLERMIAPNLNDLIVRVCRDPVRKLGYDDRFFGTMRLALKYGVEPRNLALGAAAAVAQASPAPLVSEGGVSAFLRGIWKEKADDDAAALIKLTWEGMGGQRG